MSWFDVCLWLFPNKLIMGVRIAGGKRAFAPLAIGTKKQIFLENLNSEAHFRWIDLILALTVYLPVWHSLHKSQDHYSCNACCDELEVHSSPLFFLQSQVAKLASGFFIVGLYCVTLTWQQIFKASLQKMAEGVFRIFPEVTVELLDILAQEMQRDIDYW